MPLTLYKGFMLEMGLRILAFGAGVFLVITTVLAAIRSFVLPRNESVLLSNWVFSGLRRAFTAIAKLGRTYSQRDKVMALYAPVGLVALPIVWLGVVSLGYTIIFWALDEGSLERCYRLSNSSLLTLGSEEPTEGFTASFMSYSEATLGLFLMTLLISYLPTIYQAFSRRELVVARLELRAGTEASAVELLCWLNRSGSLQDDREQWEIWEEWFVEIEETHTSLPVLSFFRSPQPGRSWVMAAAIILDAAALLISAVEMSHAPNITLCFKAGCVAINRVSRFFKFEAQTKAPTPVDGKEPLEDPERQDFEDACEQLSKAGIPLKADVEGAWEQYQQLRIKYAGAVDYLAKLTMAPVTKPI
ncbi:hypothetical protein [Hymenobacter sublimis]|uniref:DUF4129 domain-containing protein n=1 Tax=Hymenobacter sublimis TaxID=2933777 RepID=A0ABY4J974_9BACT|nr:hypothetical protein [Hymenobacter sublimis]UPL49378.1 hypothetical protein MWH26_00330 [Hymenobacter sublimis]